ncbi:hypothetical protein E2C01_062151 [Portunus trituberculatus]|uniref:Uncharacterized protein n=1 Tax=Portunus trituberculatus TaxID=210409 RepID=A0A5B7HA70_PORTR|nr:hypothetical protein [Portunus trituberculatus]
MWIRLKETKVISARETLPRHHHIRASRHTWTTPDASATCDLQVCESRDTSQIQGEGKAKPVTPDWEVSR